MGAVVAGWMGMVEVESLVEVSLVKEVEVVSVEVVLVEEVEAFVVDGSLLVSLVEVVVTKVQVATEVKMDGKAG